MSRKEKTRIFHDYIFEEYSEASGSLTVEKLPKKVHIRDRYAAAVHEIDVRLVVDVRLKSLCTLVLSYSRIDDTSART